MPLLPGNNPVIFVVRTYDGPPDKFGVQGPVDTPYTVLGNSMQPVSASDNITDTTYSEATWKCISPAIGIIPAIKAEDKLTFNGTDYRIIGVKPYYDNWARLDHVTFMCKEENG